MIVPGAAPAQLTYCTNIHPGERWAEVRETLRTRVARVAREVAGTAPFGVGLRLSDCAARELAAPAALEELRALLAEQQLYVFTLNGFPYGPFHGRRVKEDAYLPDWLQSERAAYSDRLAELLAALLPEGGAGSVSTVPGAFCERLKTPDDVQRMSAALVESAARLHALRERTGRTVALALEPEPWCFLETLADAARYFGAQLFGEPALRRFSECTGLRGGAAGDALRRHLGVCLDACHEAVAFAELEPGLEALAAVGARVLKIQLSAGLRLPEVGADLHERLEPFADPVYLHQVVARRPDGTRARWLDLPGALEAARGAPPVPGEEWRVHFHVPLFLERFDPAGRLASTRPFLEALLARQRAAPLCEALEVETYTWDVLPAEHRRGDVESAIARELRWVLGELAAGRRPSPGCADS